jgi:type VI secretion system protein ImpC
LGENQKIKMLNATKKELVKDFKSALEFDQSAMFKKVYEEEFGTFGGAPLAPDRRFRDHAPAGRHVLHRADVARCGRRACAFITAASPELFGLESFTELGKPRDLSKVFDTVEYAKWKSFRESEDSRYVGLTCRASSAACPSIRRTARQSKASTSSRMWMAPTIPNTCGATPPTPSAAS